MRCPQCGYEKGATDVQCPRCQGQGLPGQGAAGQAPGVAADDAPSTGRAVLSFFLPLVGGILYLADRQTRPKRARSAGLGALIGCGAGALVLPAILIMAAILFPVFARARENARRASCQSNLKQLSLAVTLYTHDHRQLPDLSTPESMRAALGPYVKNPEIYKCPSGGVYAGNPQVNRMAIEEVPAPAQVPMIVETEGVHLDGHNIAFVDGHVKWFKAGT